MRTTIPYPQGNNRDSRRTSRTVSEIGAIATSFPSRVSATHQAPQRRKAPQRLLQSRTGSFAGLLRDETAAPGHTRGTGRLDDGRFFPRPGEPLLGEAKRYLRATQKPEKNWEDRKKGTFLFPRRSKKWIPADLFRPVRRNRSPKTSGDELSPQANPQNRQGSLYSLPDELLHREKVRMPFFLIRSHGTTEYKKGPVTTQRFRHNSTSSSITRQSTSHPRRRNTQPKIPGPSVATCWTRSIFNIITPQKIHRILPKTPSSISKKAPEEISSGALAVYTLLFSRYTKRNKVSITLTGSHHVRHS